MPVYRPRRAPKPLCIKPFKLKKYKQSRRLGRPAEVLIQDGPLAGRSAWPGRTTYEPHTLAIRCYSGTLIISIRGESGHYDVAGRWVPWSPLIVV